ncbi:MAG: sulfite exporter TauE/SafE family protein [Betaproteobacteria bacterium]|nr:sulfite exporter TauE/SafE family protein [Betaproteobacteria bacterium]
MRGKIPFDLTTSPSHDLTAFRSPDLTVFSSHDFPTSRSPGFSGSRSPDFTTSRYFGLGLVWGWLPCGMVYAVLIAAAAAADPLHGALLRAAFGLGTLPNLLAVSAWFGNLAMLSRTRVARAVMAALIAGVGAIGLVKAAQPAHAHGGSWSAPGDVQPPARLFRQPRLKNPCRRLDGGSVVRGAFLLIPFVFVRRRPRRRDQTELSDHAPQARPGHSQNRAGPAAVPAGRLQNAQHVRLFDLSQAALRRRLGGVRRVGGSIGDVRG